MKELRRGPPKDDEIGRATEECESTLGELGNPWALIVAMRVGDKIRFQFRAGYFGNPLERHLLLKALAAGLENAIKGGAS